jgi:XTP/dITP diphosphohydrolase
VDEDFAFMPRLLVATTNRKKSGEMVQILTAAELDFDIVTLADLPDAPPVEETGETFMENAHLKARAAVAQTGLLAIADDGGLVIDALDGAPGVHSHRFLGDNATFNEKMDRILTLLSHVPDENRTCRFVCAVVIATPDGSTFECIGTCEGRIAHEKRGAHGFGYDPIFLFPENHRHMAELLPEQKHKVSHRGKALSCAVEHLRGKIL